VVNYNQKKKKVELWMQMMEGEDTGYGLREK